MDKKEALKALGLEEGASDNDIKRAFIKLALKYHPDRNLENTKENTPKFQEINEAHDILIGKTANIMDENIDENTTEDWLSSFFKVPTKNEYMEYLAELFSAAGLDVDNLQIINKMKEEAIEMVVHNLSKLFENNCLTQDSFNVACNHLTWPEKGEHDISNPYVSKFIFETLVSKSDLTASLTCNLKDYHGLVEAFNILSGHENLITQERLNHLLNNPKSAEDIAYVITRLNSVKLLNPKNESFVLTYLDEMGAGVFSTFTYSIRGKNAEKTRDILEQASTRFNWAYEREGSVNARREANLTKTLENQNVFKHHRNSQQLFPSQEFETFKQNYSSWFGKEVLFSIVQGYLNIGLMTGKQLSSLHYLMINFIRSPQSKNLPEALMRGLVTLDELNKISEWSEAQGIYNDSYLSTLLSDDCIFLMQQGLFSQEDVYAFTSSPSSEMDEYIKKQVLNFHSNAVTAKIPENFKDRLKDLSKNTRLHTSDKEDPAVLGQEVHPTSTNHHGNTYPFFETNIDWNLCFKILSAIAAVAGGAMLVVGLLLPVPGLAIAGACLLVTGVVRYAASQQNPEGEGDAPSFGLR